MNRFSSAAAALRFPLLLAATSLLLSFPAYARENKHMAAEASESEWESTWNIAVIGAFTEREVQTSVLPPEDLLDFVLIAGIDKDNFKVHTEILPVTLPDSPAEAGRGESRYEDIERPDLSALYTEHGYESLLQALESDMGIRIDDYLFLDWNAIIDEINVLHGVEAEISEEEFFYINAYTTEIVKLTGRASTILKKSGVNYFDGVQLAAYSRLKTSDHDPEHLNRQKKALSLAWKKAVEADCLSLYRVFQVMLPQIETSIDAEDMEFLLRYGRLWV